MKKLFLSTGFILVFLSLVQAQRNVAFGPVAGFGHASVSGEGSNKIKAAGTLGVQLIYSTNEHIGIGGDLRYSIEGAEKEIDDIDYSLRLNYLRIPIKLMYFFNDYGDRIRPKVSFGPSFGFLVGGKQHAEGFEADVKDDFKGFDFGLTFGAGLNFRLLSETWLTLDLNYYNGLSDISEHDDVNKNRNITLNLGLTFGIAKAKEND